MSDKRIGAYFIDKGVVSNEQLSFCIKIQKSNGNSQLGQVLKHYNFVSESDIADALAQQVGWEVFTGQYVLDEDVVKILGLEFLMENVVFPLAGGQTAMVVLARTDDTATTDIIIKKIGKQVRFYLGLESAIRHALGCHNTPMPVAPQCLTSGDQLLVWFEELIRQAVLVNASDIHIEPSAKAIEIRFRVDGLLRFIDSLKLILLPKLVNIIFNKAEVTISDFYHFHDARFTHICLNHELDIRVSHIPSVHGSALVLRLLDKNKAAMKLTDLGYDEKHWDLIEANLIRPDGVTLIVGPTGCGKTTSLYAMLNILKSISRKIVTVEDPVEVRLPLITQLQIQEARGVGFGESVRAFLRHDPDIMLIGEIRDGQTAQESMRAAMTGHKVFATLHTTRALDALLRLNDLGVQTHYIAHCLSMVMAQRLVRKLCPHCKSSRSVNKNLLRPYLQKYLSWDEQVIFEPKGCERCSNGFMGRTVIAEILTIDETVKSIIFRKQWDLLEEQVMAGSGYISFVDDAKRIILQGISSLDEIVRILG